MQVIMYEYNNNSWISSGNRPLKGADIVFTFGDREAFIDPVPYNKLKELYPDAHIVGCTSSGNILGDKLSEAPMVASAVSFDSGHVAVSVENFSKDDDQIAISNKLISKLPKDGLKHVFILSDGLNINGSSLALGANEALEHKVPITGGLAGDDIDFEHTLVIGDDVARHHRIVAVGFYGESLHVTNGCYGGWQEFGIHRKITKSKDNIVYEVDGEPALVLYKKYLGEYAEIISDSRLHFSFGIKENEDAIPVVRSVVAINEESQSLTFAGNVPEGSLARLMKTDVDGLIDGAEIAAKKVKEDNYKNALGLVVSCLGRKLVLKQLTDEEIEGVSTVLGDGVSLIGFYSYGELAPMSDEKVSCSLRNQTLTLTIIHED